PFGRAWRTPALVRDLREARRVLLLLTIGNLERKALLIILPRHGFDLVAAGSEIHEQPGREAVCLQHGVTLGVADLHLDVAEEAAVGRREHELHRIAAPARVVAALLRHAGADIAHAFIGLLG